MKSPSSAETTVKQTGRRLNPSPRFVTNPKISLTGQSWYPTMIRICSVILFFAIWEVYGRFQNPLTFAPASSVIVSLFEMMGTAELWISFGQTFSTFLVGLIVALFIAIPLGLLMGQFRQIGEVMRVYMMFLIVLPMSALVPIVTMIFGIDVLSRIVTVILFAAPEVVMSTYAAVKRLERSYVELGRSFCATSWQMFSKIIFQASLPGIMAGVKLGTARALVGMIVAEMLIVSVGLGRILDNYAAQFLAPKLFATVLLMLVISVLILQAVQLVERKLLHWKR